MLHTKKIAMFSLPWRHFSCQLGISGFLVARCATFATSAVSLRLHQGNRGMVEVIEGVLGYVYFAALSALITDHVAACGSSNPMSINLAATAARCLSQFRPSAAPGKFPFFGLRYVSFPAWMWMCGCLEVEYTKKLRLMSSPLSSSLTILRMDVDI